MSSKMAGMFKKPTEYSLNSVIAFYLQASATGGNPSLNDMAEMFAMKFKKDGYLDS